MQSERDIRFVLTERPGVSDSRNITLPLCRPCNQNCGEVRSQWGSVRVSTLPPEKINPKQLMNATQMKGDWNMMKGKLKQKWADLTDDDLTFAEGKMDEMIGRIQKRTGETREAVQKAMDEYDRECRSDRR